MECDQIHTTPLNNLLPKVHTHHYIIQNVPWPHLPPSWKHLHPPHQFNLCHFYADWKEKRNLWGVICCDATNPNTTNHRSGPPCSTQALRLPAATSHLLQVRLRCWGASSASSFPQGLCSSNELYYSCSVAVSPTVTVSCAIWCCSSVKSCFWSLAQ